MTCFHHRGEQQKAWSHRTTPVFYAPSCPSVQYEKSPQKTAGGQARECYKRMTGLARIQGAMVVKRSTRR